MAYSRYGYFIIKPDNIDCIYASGYPVISGTFSLFGVILNILHVHRPDGESF